MRFSIVTISFNQVQFLEAAIQSVLSQEYDDLEYIVVDPGSTDGSRELLEKYRDRITTLILEPDEGPSDGLNRGFARATGDVYGFLNADDILLPGALRAVAPLFAARPEVDVITGHCYIIDGDGRKRRVLYSNRFNTTAILYGGANLAQPSTFFRRTAFEKAGGFNKKNRRNWDTELWLEMGRAGCRFELIDQFLSGYRIYAGTITAANQDPKSIFQPTDDARQLLQRHLNRPWNRWDNLLQGYHFVSKWLIEPRNLIERLTAGRVKGEWLSEPPHEAPSHTK
ncbi:glycosyltransferase family 2 protein [Planctomicrobium sp. SH664]|uniref:glycosyltransferase family 2 protein n=1 Tax=Planctomicrobium sp. SH664 TaxID=3448125 RepID=UPI003F5B08F3